MLDDHYSLNYINAQEKIRKITHQANPNSHSYRSSNKYNKACNNAPIANNHNKNKCRPINRQIKNRPNIRVEITYNMNKSRNIEQIEVVSKQDVTRHRFKKISQIICRSITIMFKCKVLKESRTGQARTILIEEYYI